MKLQSILLASILVPFSAHALESATSKNSTKEPLTRDTLSFEQGEAVVSIVEIPASDKQEIVGDLLPEVTLPEVTLAEVTREGSFEIPGNTRYTAQSDDPLNMFVEWDHDPSTTLGEAIEELVDFIGYTMVVNDHVVPAVYAKTIPAIQRRLSFVTVKEGIEILSGRSLVTRFDHANRIVIQKATESLWIDIEDNR